MGMGNWLKLAFGAAAITGAANAEEGGYELISAALDGRPTIAIIDGHGTAIAVEMEEEGVQIVRGIAAGAILSDLQAAAESRPDGLMRYEGPLLDGRPFATRLNRDDIYGLIARLPNMKEAQRAELRRLLSL